MLQREELEKGRNELAEWLHQRYPNVFDALAVVQLWALGATIDYAGWLDAQQKAAEKQKQSESKIII